MSTIPFVVPGNEDERQTATNNNQLVSDPVYDNHSASNQNTNRGGRRRRRRRGGNDGSSTDSGGQSTSDRAKKSIRWLSRIKSRYALLAVVIGLILQVATGGHPISTSFTDIAALAFIVLFALSLRRRFPNFPSILAWVGAVILMFCLVLLFWFSAHIYAEIGFMLAATDTISFGDFGASAFQGGGITWIIRPLLRFAGRLFDALELSAFGLLFVMLFAILQFLECAPIVIRSSPRTLQNVIGAFKGYKKLDYAGDESVQLSKLIDQHNNYYENFFAALAWGRVIAYGIDFCMCLLHALWVKGGWAAWQVNQFTFGFDDISWAGVFRILVTLFFFERVCWLWVQCRKGYYLFAKKKV